MYHEKHDSYFIFLISCVPANLYAFLKNNNQDLFWVCKIYVVW